jgi:hypothetical protein
MYGKLTCQDIDKKPLEVIVKAAVKDGKTVGFVSIKSGELSLCFNGDGDDLHDIGHLLRMAAKEICKCNGVPYSPPKSNLDVYE